MGFEQMWRIRSLRRWQEAWPRLVADVRLLLDAADMDLTSDRVWDLVEAQDEAQHPDGSSLADRLEKLHHPPPPLVDEEQGICVNGIHADGCEPLVLEKWPRSYNGQLEEGSEMSFQCKTNRRPYTLIVDCVLLRAKQLLGDGLLIFLQPTEDTTDRSNYLISVLWPDEEIPSGYGDDWDDDNVFVDTAQDESYVEQQSPIHKCANIALPLRRKSISENNMRAPSLGIDLHKLLLDLPENLCITVRQWVEECNSKGNGHAACSPLPRKRLPLLRVIDIDRQCVTAYTDDMDFVALSYMWGTSQQSKLLGGNIANLTKPGGLFKDGFQVSRTILEAMAVSQQLNYRYLWADAICILQDDAQDKMFQLNTMREVYSMAAVTIVAAFGADATSGLGLDQYRSFSPKSIERSDIGPSFLKAVSKSAWNTRGWTLQEKLLSQSLLLFTQDGVYFTCASVTRSENGIQRMNLDTVSCDRPGTIWRVPSGKQMEVYLKLIQTYSTRVLTHESDYGNAIKGILRAFGHSVDGLPNSFYETMPTCAFDELFSWRTELHQPQSRRAEFSSWSWQGWRQTPQFPTAILDRLQNKPNRIGSVLIQYDRIRFERTPLDSYGYTDSSTAPIYLFTCGGRLRIAKKCDRFVGDTDGWYRVFSGSNGQTAGTIQLNREWRAKKQGRLKFIPIWTESCDDGARIKTLMCLERSMQNRTFFPTREFVWERVQVMDCNIHEHEWVAMMGGSMPRWKIWIG